jgi:hypothetical protein
MSVSSERPASRSGSRGRSSSGASGSRGRSSSAASGTSQGRSSRSTSPRPNSAKRPDGNAASKARGNSAAATPSNSSEQAANNHGARETITNIGIGMLGASIGVAGGVLLGRTALQRNRKVLGIPVPNKIDLAGVSQQIGEASRQVGKLAGEVRAARQKAEQVGRILS